MVRWSMVTRRTAVPDVRRHRRAIALAAAQRTSTSTHAMSVVALRERRCAANTVHEMQWGARAPSASALDPAGLLGFPNFYTRES